MTTNTLNANGHEPVAVDESLPTVFIDDVLMSLKYYVDENKGHVHIVEQEVCQKCTTRGCLYFCPAGAYRAQADGQIQISYQSCIECGSCRVMCPNNNIEWNLPRGGFGVSYKFG